ncbi:phosphatase PAP2 family protein [Deinococcus multiflagellatus]|uniref:Phosphatase PAP2 family protein n=2 Tax=Deinococcus multiflagellatus TaxID=1656887 RepID=A0ABW1ZHG6_9DEIO
MAVVFVLIPAWLWQRRRPADAASALLGLGSAVGTAFVMKLLFHRARPELWPRLVAETGASFPSGHATVAAALATCVALLLWRTPLRWPGAAACLLYALLSGAARLALGVHYPSDVLAGWLTGWVCVLSAHNVVHAPWGQRLWRPLLRSVP